MSGHRPSPGRKAIRQALTIARRDFIATVFTPVFLLFLFAPFIAGSISAIVGVGAASVAADGGGNAKARMVAIVTDAKSTTAADARLRHLFRPTETPPELTVMAPRGDADAQARTAFTATDYETVAVLYGPLDRPTILYGPHGPRAAEYLASLAQATLVDDTLGSALPRIEARRIAVSHAAPAARGGRQSGFTAMFGIFFLTLFLASQSVGTMAEERNNKVIEVLAASVPLEAVFIGKLIGLFGSALAFIGFWVIILSQIGLLMPAVLRDGLAVLAPATGLAFPLLFMAYFTMAYLLLGSVFLGVGAQASTPREIQMLSLPITVTQMAMFALAWAAAARPGSGLALIAELFPLSSPFAMVGHAANQPGLWRHVAALAWQALWVALFITIGARLFRRGVLQSGSARSGWWRRRRPIDIPVS